MDLRRVAATGGVHRLRAGARPDDGHPRADHRHRRGRGAARAWRDPARRQTGQRSPTPSGGARARWSGSAATAEELAALDALGNSGHWQVGGHTVNLTNLDKVLWPGPGYTKRDLVRY